MPINWDTVWSDLTKRVGGILTASELAIQSSGFNGVVYHYCDGTALEAIIRTGELRATNLGYMNDKEEYLHGYKMAVEILKNVASSSVPQKHKDLLPLIEADFADPLFQPFCISFSRDGDKLSQWRGYAAQGEGYCIGMDFKGIDYAGFDTIRSHVTYDLVEQEKYLSDILTTCFQVFDIYENQLGGNLSEIALLFRTVIQVSLAQLKNPHFKEEDESRAIMHVSQTKWVPSVKYYVRKNRIVPYLPFVTTTSKLPIVEIVLGPGASSKQNEIAVKTLLISNGYASPKVVPSKIPFAS